MRKLIACMLAGLLLAGAWTPQAEAREGGGIAGFFIGCCLGMRTAADWNDGKDLHFRDWCRLIPYVNIVFAIWDGVDGAQGVGRAQLAAKYGASYY